MHNLPTLRKNGMGKQALHDETGTLAGRLALAMELRGKTNPSQIETATGITRQALYRVLDGKTEKLTWVILVKLADHLGVRPEWLQDGVLPMHKVPELKDDEEIRLIDDFRHMSPHHQRDLADIARRWAEEDYAEESSRPFIRTPKLPPTQ